jgi:hypothetical protein
MILIYESNGVAMIVTRNRKDGFINRLYEIKEKKIKIYSKNNKMNILFLINIHERIFSCKFCILGSYIKIHKVIAHIT